MRTLLALTIFAAGTLALNSAVDAGTMRKSKRAAKLENTQQYAKRQSSDLACEERARNEDPSGAYAGLPCWAREAIARGHNHSSN